jgi:hypothetical protein
MKAGEAEMSEGALRECITAALEPCLAEIKELRELNAELLADLKRLVADVEPYEAWRRPCYALHKAKETIAKAEKLK